MRRAGPGGASRGVAAALVLGALGALLLPWYAIEEGFFSLGWQPWYPLDPELAPGPVQVARYGRAWLVPLIVLALAPAAVLRRPRSDQTAAWVLLLSGSLGLAFGAAQGFLIGPTGPIWAPAGADSPVRQYGMGAGGLAVHLAFVLYLSLGLARRGALRGDGFVACLLGVVGGSVVLFVFFPLVLILLRALEAEDGSLSATVLAGNLASARLWAVPTAWDGPGSGVGTAWRTLLLGILAASGSTLLGLAFALVATRTRFRAKRLLRALTVLPIITPPFVLGLALILIFGRAGAVTLLLEQLTGLSGTRYIFGLPGILIAQLLAITPVCFLVLIGVVEGISPSMEEAAQTLRADRWRTFVTVTLPLMRPGLANAFLLAFIESLADFGNPLVLGGSYEVLATDIYFAVAGAESDLARAAALSIVLLAFTLAAFWAQRRWVGKKTYTTVTGKADSGAPAPLPRSVERLALGTAVPWALFTFAVYAVVLYGGFATVFGRDNTPTLEHYREVLGISLRMDGLVPELTFSGGAWSSLFTTLEVALISAPLTAGIGLATAWLLARQSFRGHALFELGTMLSFAVPGTVVGLSYILAFNDPPVELTGTAVILVVCFVFRNMPVGVRAGLASLSQVDRSLEEASLTLGASSAQTMRLVALPLLRPALVAALVYGFVRAMTAVSAVIFLVNAEHDLATTYILGRVENGGYGPATAYSSVLVVAMIAAMGSIQLLVGRRELGRRVLVE